MHSVASKILIAAGLLASYVAADSPFLITSGFASVQTLGVGPDGATTYIFYQSTTGPTQDDPGPDGPMTVAIGASTMRGSYVDPTDSIVVIENCGITNGVGVCAEIIENGVPGSVTFTTTEYETQTFSTTAVQGGAPTAVTTTSTSVSTGVSTTSTASSSASTTTTTQNKTSDGVKTTFTSFSLMMWGSAVTILMVL
ncbi:uncharacterized protein FIBRA_08416 [Fibroporia radiculosa]|uniref:GPI anchored protein n=1 Tax=Fibroporia radiculosa TaxID=599839 RepID=J4H560_9APHY|nr:uncharacterized protein FIBRA_08416 [Fibroporia radiculosa]CCM06174.1 predicted protein [Fibroporia radiculosa]